LGEVKGGAKVDTPSKGTKNQWNSRFKRTQEEDQGCAQAKAKKKTKGEKRKNLVGTKENTKYSATSTTKKIRVEGRYPGGGVAQIVPKPPPPINLLRQHNKKNQRTIWET